MGDQSYPGTVLGDVVGAAAWGSKIYSIQDSVMGYATCWGVVVFL